MKKKLCGILVVLVLSSCGLKPEAPQDFGDPVPSGPRSMAESAKDNVGLVMQSELGEMTIVVQGKGLGIQGKTGPLRYELTDYQISSLDTSQYGKDQLASDRDQLTVLTIALYLKNEAATPLVIFPDQGRLQTGSETKVASAIKTDVIGGTLAGQEETAGLITFYLERPAEEIASFTYHMPGPVNEAQEILGEDVGYIHPSLITGSNASSYFKEGTYMLMKVLGVALIFLGLLGLSSIFFDFSALRLILAFILLSAGTGLVRS